MASPERECGAGAGLRRSGSVVRERWICVIVQSILYCDFLGLRPSEAKNRCNRSIHIKSLNIFSGCVLAFVGVMVKKEKIAELLLFWG